MSGLRLLLLLGLTASVASGGYYVWGPNSPSETEVVTAKVPGSVGSGDEFEPATRSAEDWTPRVFSSGQPLFSDHVLVPNDPPPLPVRARRAGHQDTVVAAAETAGAPGGLASVIREVGSTAPLPVDAPSRPPLRQAMQVEPFNDVTSDVGLTVPSGTEEPGDRGIFGIFSLAYLFGGWDASSDGDDGGEGRTESSDVAPAAAPRAPLRSVVTDVTDVVTDVTDTSEPAADWPVTTVESQTNSGAYNGAPAGAASRSELPFKTIESIIEKTKPQNSSDAIGIIAPDTAVVASTSRPTAPDRTLDAVAFRDATDGEEASDLPGRFTPTRSAGMPLPSRPFDRVAREPALRVASRDDSGGAITIVRKTSAGVPSVHLLHALPVRRADTLPEVAVAQVTRPELALEHLPTRAEFAREQLELAELANTTYRNGIPEPAESTDTTLAAANVVRARVWDAERQSREKAEARRIAQALIPPTTERADDFSEAVAPRARSTVRTSRTRVVVQRGADRSRAIALAEGRRIAAVRRAYQRRAARERRWGRRYGLGAAQRYQRRAVGTYQRTQRRRSRVWIGRVFRQSGK